MAQASEEPKNFPARPDKTIDQLNKSRDDWKSKTLSTKAELKIAKQAQRRARQSRQEWKEEYRQLERQLAAVIAEKDEENSTLKAKMQELERENEGLKKKYLLRLMTKKQSDILFPRDIFVGACAFYKLHQQGLDVLHLY